MGYGMKYKKGKGFPFKTDLKDLRGTKDDGSTYKILEKDPVGPVDKNVENDDDQVQENMDNKETLSGETFLNKMNKLHKNKKN